MNTTAKLTRAEIDALEAGREMDALIHKLVMRKERPGGFDTPSWRDGYLCEETFYSTDIAAVWPMVEKDRLCVLPWGSDEWCCTDKRGKRGLFTGAIAVGGTAMLAICRFALYKAMGLND